MTSYRAAVYRPIHRNLYEVAVPGVLRRYVLDWIPPALNRSVTFLNPLDALGKPERLTEVRRKLGPSDRIQVEFRGRRDSLRQFLGSGE